MVSEDALWVGPETVPIDEEVERRYMERGEFYAFFVQIEPPATFKQAQWVREYIAHYTV